MINLKEEYEISCFTRINPTQDDQFLIGFGKGDIVYYKEPSEWFGKTPVPIKKCLYKDSSQEGSIISIIYSHKIMAWATAKMVRVAYYTNLEKNESKKICFIEVP